jgi:ABC-2 type transport system ATP-binding protein
LDLFALKANKERNGADMSGDGDMVRVEGLRKRYDKLTAVDGVSFHIRRGEIFGLLGPNGAGKTTTISMIAGLLTPTEGTIHVGGKDAVKGGSDVRRMIGVVPQELAIYPRLTAQENLEFFGRLYGLSDSLLSERVREMLALVGLSERAGSFAETFSGGMKRRLNLAVGLMHNPRLLLLDEPTVGVDPQSRNHIFEGVRALNKQGLTILYTSHYMEEVEALCDRVGIMDKGTLIACDTTYNLAASQGGAVIEIALDTPETPETLTTTLRGLADVHMVESLHAESDELPHATIKLSGERINAALPAIISQINHAGIGIQNLSIHQPNLEDVFLALTGKTLRD